MAVIRTTVMKSLCDEELRLGDEVTFAGYDAGKVVEITDKYYIIEMVALEESLLQKKPPHEDVTEPSEGS